METVLPNISCLKAISVTRWSEFGDRLREIGLNSQYISGICQSGYRSFESLQMPLITRYARLRKELPAFVYRMFGLHDSVSEDEALEALGYPLFRELLDSGVLIRPKSGYVLSVFELRVVEDLFILCDDLSHKGEAVFGVGPGTAAFYRAIPQGKIAEKALDLGCGAGAAALLISKYARCVIATDINPRALEFVQVNSAINRVKHVEVRLGNLFEAVAGEVFNLIISQPPFVPSPPGIQSALYRHGGPLGTELPLKIISEAPSFLATNGRAVIVFEKPVFDREINLSHEFEPNLDENLHTLLILGAEVDADAYSIRYAAAELRSGVSEFDKAVKEMRDHLDHMHIHSMRPAICILEPSTPFEGWMETAYATHSLWGEVSGGLIDRLLAGHILIKQPPHKILQARLHIPAEAMFFTPFQPCENISDKGYLGLPPGYLISFLELSQCEWKILQSLYKTSSGESASIYPLLTSDNEEAQYIMLNLIARFAREGLLHVN